MKKIIIMAFVALFATTAFAQNPDALKQIKKAKSAEEVASLIKNNESSMSASENAQAYNKLVDLHMKNVIDTQTAIQANNLAGKEPTDNVDMEAFYNDLAEAYKAALMCDLYDMQPNEKGKIAPKFRKANGDRLYGDRAYLINAAQDAQTAENNKKAGELFALYVDTGSADLFAEQAAAKAKDAENGIADEYLSEVARVASLMAFNEGDLDTAMKYADIVIEDPNPEKENEGISLKVYYLGRNLKTHEDSVKCLETFKEMYAKYPKNETAFSQLASMYGNMGQKAEQQALISEFLKENPKNFTAWALKGQLEMTDQDYDAALADYKKALECETPDEGQRALVNTFVGFCYSQKAAKLEIREQQEEMLKEAIPYLEEARKLDPNRERYDWAYLLYQCYYFTKGEDDPATQELKALGGYE